MKCACPTCTPTPCPPGFVSCVACGRQWHASEQAVNFVQVDHGGGRYTFCDDSTSCPAVFSIFADDEQSECWAIGSAASRMIARRREIARNRDLLDSMYRGGRR